MEDEMKDWQDAQRRNALSWQAGLCCCWRCMEDRNEIRSHMILCPTCGNKRCPKASDHRLECTGSNEPGQAGSVYGVSPHPMNVDGGYDGK